MRDHLQQWSARAKPKLTLVDSIRTVIIVALFFSKAARAAKPVALLTGFQWNMGKNMVLGRPYGLDLSKWFNLTDVNTAYSVIPENPSWCRLDTTYASSRGILTISRTLKTDQSGPLSYTLSVVATNPEGSASVPVTATAPSPGRTARYPIPSNLLSLASQSARQAGLWFSDLFPPQSFGISGPYAGLDNVLAVTVNASGQPSARVAAFNDSSLSNAKFNTQGRRYNVNQRLNSSITLSLSTSIYVPGDWVDNAPGKPGCTESNSALCSRVALVELELGSETGGPNGSFQTAFYARMGFDNRKEAEPGFNYATAFLGGPITEDPVTYPNWPYSSSGLYLDFPLGRTTAGWENELKKNAWNDFTFEITLMDSDIVYPAPTYTARGCQGIMMLRWGLNGKRFLSDANDPIVTRIICTKDPSGVNLPSHTDMIRDIVVTTYNPPGSTTGYTSYFGNMNFYSSTTPVIVTAPPSPISSPSPPPAVLSSSPPPPPVLFPPPPPPPVSASAENGDYEYIFFDDYVSPPPPEPTPVDPTPPSPAPQSPPTPVDPMPPSPPTPAPPSPAPVAPAPILHPPPPNPPKPPKPPRPPPPTPKSPPPPPPVLDQGAYFEYGDYDYISPPLPSPPPPKKKPPPPPVKKPPPQASASDYAEFVDYDYADGNTSGAGGDASDAIYLGDYDHTVAPPPPPKGRKSPPSPLSPPPKGWRRTPPPAEKSPSPNPSPASSAIKRSPPPSPVVQKPPPPKRNPSPSPQSSPPPPKRKPPPPKAVAGASKKSPPPPPTKVAPSPTKKSPPPPAKRNPPPSVKKSPPVKAPAPLVRKPPPPNTSKSPSPAATVRRPPPMKKTPFPATGATVKRPPPPKKKTPALPPPKKSTAPAAQKRPLPPPPLSKKKSPPPKNAVKIPPPFFSKKKPPPPKKTVVVKKPPPPRRPRIEDVSTSLFDLAPAINGTEVYYNSSALNTNPTGVLFNATEVPAEEPPLEVVFI